MNAQNFWLVIDSVRVEETAPHWCCNAWWVFSSINHVNFNFFKLREIFLEFR